MESCARCVLSGLARAYPVSGVERLECVFLPGLPQIIDLWSSVVPLGGSDQESRCMTGGPSPSPSTTSLLLLFPDSPSMP
mmetsp:Transcript_86445/g.150577  ORF Transcript_86445/g.150577 Transcript_86445/m.150577 type:complete len:80 (+) Transcript_86445:3-242(+)